MEFLLDGWYSEKDDAMRVGRVVVDETPGASFVGLVEHPGGEGWGYLYIAEDTQHEGHRVQSWVAGA